MRLAVSTMLLATAAAACGGPEDDEGACGLVAGDLVITEVFADYKAANGGTGADEGKEWFEIFNATERPLDLEGLSIVHGRPDDSKQKSHVLGKLTVAPGQYLTLGNATPDLVPAYIDYGYGTALGDMFNTDGGKLELKCGDALIDGAVYDTVVSGRSRQLSAAQPPDYTLNDEGGAWCEAAESEFEPGNFGTPGQGNDCSAVAGGQCNDGGTQRDPVPPQPGELVITEIMPGPNVADDAKGEWFEAMATGSFDLNGIGLDRLGGPMMAADIVSSADCLHVEPGDYVVFARNALPEENGGLPSARVKGTFKFSMVAGSAASLGDIAISYGTTVIDAVSWSASRSGKALQLDPDLLDPTANDTESNFCDATDPYNSGAAGPPPVAADLGTPGAANTQCASAPTEGTCDDNGVVRAIVKPAAGAVVISELLADPDGTDTSKEWFEIVNASDRSFDLNGLGLARTGGTANVITSTLCKPVAPGAYALFARSNNPANNAMLPAVDATFSFSLLQTNGTIEVRDGDGVLDLLTYPASTSGVSNQLKPGNLSADANEDPANFCPAIAGYGDMANLGTPKLANVCE